MVRQLRNYWVVRQLRNYRFFNSGILNSSLLPASGNTRGSVLLKWMWTRLFLPVYHKTLPQEPFSSFQCCVLVLAMPTASGGMLQSNHSTLLLLHTLEQIVENIEDKINSAPVWITGGWHLLKGLGFGRCYSLIKGHLEPLGIITLILVNHWLIHPDCLDLHNFAQKRAVNRHFACVQLFPLLVSTSDSVILLS